MESCYFFIDGDLPEAEQKIEVLCCGCRDKHYPNVGWYWNEQDGFGPWTYKCKICRTVIHEKESDGEAETTD